MSVCFFGVENTRRTGIEFVDIFTCISGDSATRQRQTSTIQMMLHAVAARNTDRWWWCRSEEAIPTLEYCSKHGCDSKKKSSSSSNQSAHQNFSLWKQYGMG